MIEFPKEGKIDSEENKLYTAFEERIESFVKNYLNGYSPVEYKRNKVIHDPVWGTNLFYRWELQIMDSPLLQRLRDIGQLGLSMLTYPTAHHSRFEHTLGVMAVVTKMVNHLNQGNDNEKKEITDKELYMLRLAALLHDVGHCFFSHLSESIYGNLKDFVDLKKSFTIFNSAKEHEIFAYIIINSQSFKDFVENKIGLWDNCTSKSSTNGININELFRNIGCMIVGYPISPEQESTKHFVQKFYLTQMINGQYDADKLDYLRRDSYTAGLALTYDIDRFLYKIKIAENVINDDKGNIISGLHLVIPISGVSAVEEMAFSQLMLASYIYQHQKILATDALVRDIVEGLMSINKLNHPCDFLNYCDSDILSMYNKNPDKDFSLSVSQQNFNAVTPKKISDIVRGIKDRELPKRAFAVNYSLVNGIKEKKQYAVADIADRLKKIDGLRKSIVDEAQKISNFLPSSFSYAKQPIDFYDVYISIPKTSIAKDLSNALVITSDNKFVNLSEIVRLSDWVDAFAWHKWNAYIFAKAEILPIVSVASKIVFEKHGLIFDESKLFVGLGHCKDATAIYQYLKNNGYR